MSYVSTVLADLPATGSFWQFSEASGTLVDSGGGAHNSTDNSNLIYRLPGPLQSGESSFALGFDGATSSTGFGTGVYEFLGTSSFSAECWIKPSDLSTAPFVIQKQTTGAEGWYFRVLSNGVAEAVRQQAAAADTLDSAAGLVSSGGWTYLVDTYDGTSQRVYVNGNLVAGPTASAKSVQTNANSFCLGGRLSGGNKLNGSMALPAIYPGVVLNQSQISAHFALAQPPVPPAPPVMMWP